MAKNKKIKLGLNFEHPRDKRITFDPVEHKYWVDGEEYNGVTSWLKNFVPKFDRERISKLLAFRRGVLQKCVLDEWDESVFYGKLVHGAFEDLLLTGEIKKEAEEEIHGIITLYELLELTPIRSEWVIYNEDIKRASAIDGVFLNKKGEVVIVDIKTYKEMTFDGYKGKTMFSPLDHLPDSKYWMTCLQIGVYDNWLRKYYDVPVSDKHYIFHVNRDVVDYHESFNLSSEVEQITKML
jgi:hypothetical protein